MRETFPCHDVIMSLSGIVFMPFAMTQTATNRNDHRPKQLKIQMSRLKRPQTEIATDRNGHKPKRPQNVSATWDNIFTYSNTLRPEYFIRLFAHFTAPLSSSLCGLIWRHWAYKCLSYIFCRVCIWDKHNYLNYLLSNIWAVCFLLTHFSCDDLENVYTLSYYH